MTTKRVRLKRADAIAEAPEMAQDTFGANPNPSRTYLHAHPAATHVRGLLPPQGIVF